MNRQVETHVKAAAPMIPPAAPARATLVATFAAKMGVEPAKLLPVLKDTAFKQPSKDGKAGPEVTDAQMMALLVVANEYGLNPFTKEIYAFPAKGGGIVPFISVDGWIRIMNRRPEFRGLSLTFGEFVPDNAADYWVEATILRSDRDVPMTIREYLSECYRNTDPWNQKPRTMTRHKAIIQCIRVAFGYAGVYDEDDALHMANAQAIDSTATEVRGKPATEEPRRIEAPVPEAKAYDLADLRRVLDESGLPENALLAHYEAGTLEGIPAAKYGEAIAWVRGLSAAG